MELPPAIRAAFEHSVGLPVKSSRPLSGGDNNDAFLIETAEGPFFLKTNRRPAALEMFKSEQKSLHLLQTNAAIAIPRVIKTEQTKAGAYLVLEYIRSGRPGHTFWEDFGRQLARMHQCTGPEFGLDFDNFIGILPQSNKPHQHWASFYISERLKPQVKLAFDAHLLTRQHLMEFEQLYQKLEDLLPQEPPTLIHGDLWSGNFICGPQQEAYLIDPAPAFAHREMDIAMAQLFGGFSPIFFSSYHHHYPLAPGLKERLPLYQLYYLLVHLNLFGASYSRSVLNIVQRYS